jgi:hypothetical protein
MNVTNRKSSMVHPKPTLFDETSNKIKEIIKFDLPEP